MEMDDLVLISVDDHLVEPPDMFDEHLPAKWKAEAPQVVTKADGSQVWAFHGLEAPNFAVNASAGKRPEDKGLDPTSFDDMRRGCWDVHERVRDMNANGVLGSMNFPSFPGFAGRFFAAHPDPAVAHVLLQAYNDWHLDQWCASYPDRFIPLGLPVIWDPELSAAEVRRLAAKGCRALSFPENPANMDYPSFHSNYWDPLWAACQDEGVVVCLHIGSSGKVVVTAPDAPVDVTMVIQPLNIVHAAADVLFSPVLRKFPEIRFALSEGGIGWVPYFLHRVDRLYRMQSPWTGMDFGDLLPSEVFAERVVTCFIDDPVGTAQIDALNIDNVTWECDFPHSDSPWPTAPELIHPQVAHLDDATIDKITYENAMRIFQFDPFTHRTRENSTVAALRADATDVVLTTETTRRASRGGTATRLQELVDLGN